MNEGRKCIFLDLNGSRTLTITTTDPLRVAVDTGSHQGTYSVAAGTRTISVTASSW